MALLDHDYGFDFDPVTDRVRVISSDDANVSINPDTGVFTFAGLVGNSSENIFAVAYDRSHRGASATTLYGIDFDDATLVRIGGVDGAPSADDGDVTPIGELFPGAGAILGDSIGGFDIEARTGAAYAVLFNTNSDTGLVRIDLETGAATGLGLINTRHIRHDPRHGHRRRRTISSSSATSPLSPTWTATA